MNGRMDFKEFLVWNLGGIVITFIVIAFLKGVS